jgi:MFS-type transporter involved in bile tolerance (Atg22 family)
MTGKTNNGVFSIILLFIIGGAILMKVPPPSENITQEHKL